MVIKNYAVLAPESDRMRLIRQDVLVPKEIFSITEDIEFMRTFVNRKYRFLTMLLSREPSDDDITIVYRYARMRRIPFNHEKIKQFIRSLDSKNKFFRDLKKYKVHSIDVHHYKNGAEIIKENMSMKCASAILDVIHEIEEVMKCNIKMTINLIENR